jgi:hypothetical protein
MRAMAEEAMGSNPRTVPGPWCKHCTARHACPALRATTLGILDVVADTTADELDAPALGYELALVTRAKELLEARYTGLAAQTETLLRIGQTVPGWGIEHTRGSEVWTKPVDEVLMLGTLLGVSLAGDVKALTPNQARQAGLDPAVVASYSERRPGAARLAAVDLAAARRAFGGGS